MTASARSGEPALDEAVALLRAAGARFVFLHGSRAEGEQRADSDVDVAALFDHQVDEADLRSRVPAGVDLLVLDRAPLELAGRVALHGRVLAEDDAARRVEWQAMTRKIYLDERFRVEQARADLPRHSAMVDPERLARLLRSLSDDVARLEPHASAAPGDVLGDDVRLDHVKYRFITAIEAVVDAADHICATEGLRNPATNADAVRELAELGVLPRDLADEVARAVGFRNVLVHRYVEVVDEHVVDQLGRLAALRDFVRAVSGRYL